MLPILHKELVERRKWIDSKELLDYFAIGQCTPGIIAVNTSTLIGYKRLKLPGALAATFGFILPSFIVITLLATVIRDFSHIEAVEHAFSGVRVAVVALVFVAIAKLWKSAVKDAYCFLIFFSVLLVSAFFKLSPVYIIICVLVIGLFLKKGEYPQSTNCRESNSEHKSEFEAVSFENKLKNKKN